MALVFKHKRLEFEQEMETIAGDCLTLDVEVDLGYRDNPGLGREIDYDNVKIMMYNQETREIFPARNLSHNSRKSLWDTIEDKVYGAPARYLQTRF